VKPWSLQRSLIAIAFAVSLGAWAAGGALTFVAAQRHAEELHDIALRQTAKLLMGLSVHEVDELAGANLEARIANGKADTATTLGEDYRYQLWGPTGNLLLSNFGLPSAAAMAKMGSPGYSWLHMDGQLWRVYTLVVPDTGEEIQLAERAATRGWFLHAIDWKLLLLGPLSLLLVFGAGLVLVRRVMRPLRTLSEEVDARGPANRTQMALDGAPSELQPIVGAMNGLFSRMSDAMAREAQFTSMAAHELRTPLASLRLLAQTVADADDPQVRQESIRDLIASVDRCAHLQEQLLTLAQLDASRDADMAEEANFTELVSDAVAQMAQEARAKGIAMSSRTDAALLCCHPFGVQTLLRNLLSNAVKYTPSGGRVEITVQSTRSDLRLVVDDSGCGIPEAERDRMFERFERLHRDQAAGVGLGLSIVRTVVQAHGSTITLGDSPLGGLRVVVEFAGRRIDTGPLEDAGIEVEPLAGHAAIG
jgi:signal transduction histidine kinase